MAVRRLAAHFTLLPEGLTRNCIVEVAGDGTIAGVAVSDRPDREHGVEFYSGILIPGMVNAHSHLELSHLRGAVPEGCGFTGFARAMGAGRNGSTEEERTAAVAYRDARMWAEGISATGDISNCGITLPVKASSRIYYHTFAEVYGLATASAEPMAALARTARQAGLAASVTPHSMYSLGERLLGEAVAADDGALSVHFMESRDESLLFGRSGAMWEWYQERGMREDFTGLYGSPAERLAAKIPGERKILLVHNTFVTREDVDIVNTRFGRNATCVLCPRSSRYITGSLPPVGLLRAAGCRIAVGTDSLASNTDLSLVEELKMLDGVPLEDALFYATCNGSQALGIYDTYGSIETGKRPGLVIVENVDLSRMRLTADTVTRRLV
ncbi:MAG: amidohydrolase family protein [Alistipes sp.]|nr:amidohydrolase family protein [Alistipes sp.]